jgi:hypothetical protein
MELIQFFADVVDVNNDKIANGFQIQPLFDLGDTIIMANCAFHHSNMSINNSITNCCSSHWSKVKSLSDLNICLTIWKQYSHVLS